MAADDQINARTILQRAARASTVGRLHHAWMLTGIELSPLEILAQSLTRQFLCLQSDGPSIPGGCGECQACRQYNAGTHPDHFELSTGDANNIKVDAVRQLIADIGLRPALSARKVIVVHQADLMNPAAQNAMLKTLEEPPTETFFVLTTTRYQSLLETIRSRVQRHHLRVKATEHSDVFFETLARLNSEDYPLDFSEDHDQITQWRAQLTTLRATPNTLEAFDLAQELGNKKELERFEQWLRVFAAQLKVWLQEPKLSEQERAKLWKVHESLMTYERERVFHPTIKHVSERLLLLLTRSVEVPRP